MVALRKRCDEVGALLIFDEAGFRDGSEGVGPKDCPNLANLAPSLKAPLKNLCGPSMLDLVSFFCMAPFQMCTPFGARFAP